MWTCRIVFVLCCITCGCTSAKFSAAKMAASQKDHIVEIIKQINANPVLLHGDLTPAVEKLSEIGRPALYDGVLELLLSDDVATRQHAARVLYMVLLFEAGWKYGTGWPPELNPHEMDSEIKELWKSNGDYSEDAPFEARKASYEKWKQWLRDTQSAIDAKVNS
jgi:hypothetical protein